MFRDVAKTHNSSTREYACGAASWIEMRIIEKEAEKRKFACSVGGAVPGQSKNRHLAGRFFCSLFFMNPLSKMLNREEAERKQHTQSHPLMDDLKVVVEKE